MEQDGRGMWKEIPIILKGWSGDKKPVQDPPDAEDLRCSLWGTSKTGHFLHNLGCFKHKVAWEKAFI